MSIEPIEQTRRALQERLDGQKTPAERNRLGQFATPYPLALEMACFVERHVREADRPIHFCDPAIGTGAFYSALLTAFRREEIGSASGVEIDPDFVRTARDLWGSLGLEVVEGDFTDWQTRARVRQVPNLILTNPPYVRHHHLTREQKARLRALAARLTHLHVNGLAGLYVYYLLIADAWLQDDGLSAWLIPSEFMDVNYGEVLRRYLSGHVSLVAIHRFDPETVQFEDALVSSAVVLFRKTPPSEELAACFSFGGTLLSPRVKQHVRIAELRQARKWTVYPRQVPAPAGGAVDEPLLSQFFRIQRGIATGANEFFILPRGEAVSRNIPEQFLVPILPSPRYLQATVIDAGGDGYPQIKPQLVLLSCDLPGAEIRQSHPSLWAYLETAKQTGVTSRYLVRKRQPWYRQERRAPAPFICTYMGRGIEEKRPFRFIWNRSRAVAPNVYLMLYPREPLRSLLARQPEAAPEVFAFLQTITADDLRLEGRVYGGGLHKIEPNELGRISALPLVRRFPGLSGAAAQLELW